MGERGAAAGQGLTAAVLLVLALALTGCEAAIEPTAVPTAVVAMPPRRGPPTLLSARVEPVGLTVPEGGTGRFTIVLVNEEPEPIGVDGLPPMVTLSTDVGDAVRTFPGGRGSATLLPGGSYRHDVVWDGRLDGGAPARPGRYGAGLATLLVTHAGGTTNLTMGVGERVVVVEPAGGIRTGLLPLGLAVEDQGTTLTLDRLELGRSEARIHAQARPAWPNGARLGSPLGNWNVVTEYRLDGGRPISIKSPGFGVDDPGRTSLTWTLDPLPAAAREMELTVRLSGELTRRWSFRIPL